jgi:hypothetical protein
LTPVDGDEAYGTAVLHALTSSRCFVLGAPRPGVELHPEVEFDMDLYDYKLTSERYTTRIERQMSRYSYKTKRALFKGMKTCFIERAGGVINFGPSRNEKPEVWVRSKEDGFEDVVIPAESTRTEIGAALRLAFSRCTG